MLLYFIIFFGLLIISEFGAYVWHRWAAHTDILPYVSETHDVHHEIKDDVDLRDYLYICIIMIIFAIVLASLFTFNIISFGTYLLLYTPVLIVFVWNWYIHWAYHTPDHWLNNFEWFKNDKKIHFQHHINQNVNYGIASHYTDKLFGTFKGTFKKDIKKKKNKSKV